MTAEQEKEQELVATTSIVEALSNAPKEIAAALVALQGEVQTVKKTAENAHFKNTYAQLSDVQEAALPLLSKHKLALTQWPITTNGRHYLVSILMHESGSTLRGQQELLVGRNDSQALGSAITYTRRQTTMAILGLSANDDDDGNRSANHLPAPTQQQLDQIAQMCNDLSFPPEDVTRKLAGIKSEDQAVIAIDKLNAIMAGRAAAIRARDAAAKTVVVDEAEESAKVVSASHARASAVAKRLKGLNLKSDDLVRELIETTTGKKTLAECRPWELKKLETTLEAIESGERKLPEDWYPNDIAPPEPTA